MSQLSSTRPSMQTSDGLVCSPLRPDDHAEEASGRQLNLAALWRMQDLPTGCEWEDSEEPGGTLTIPAADWLSPRPSWIRGRPHRPPRVRRCRLP